MITDELWNEFLELDLENNISFLHKYFGILSTINGFDLSQNLIHLENLDKDIFMKWYLVLDNFEYILEDKVYESGELIELLKFYYNILDNDISLALGNLHFLTGARGLIVQKDINSNEILFDLCKKKEEDFEEFIKIIINYNNQMIVLYISKGEIDYV